MTEPDWSRIVSRYHPWYDRDNQPIDVQTWTRLFGTPDYHRIASTDVATPDGAQMWVSTVWTGIHVDPFPDSPPRVFETAVFTADEDHTGWCVKYGDEASARAGHAAVVEAVRSGSLDPRSAAGPDLGGGAVET